MIGIYKIISPSKRIYIGQSINLEKRFNNYKKLSCEGQTILYRSFIKYGVENHIFEIICECSIEELNEKERYYQDLYSVLNDNGLNCMLTKTSDKNGKMANETKKKISDANKGKKRTDDCKLKISLAQRGKKLSEETKHKMSLKQKGKILSPDLLEKFKKVNIGRKATHEALINMSNAKKGFGKGKKLSEEHRKKIGLSNKGKRLGVELSTEHKLKISIGVLGKKKGYIMPENVKDKISNAHNPNKIIDLSTLIIYNSIREASLSIPINRNTLKSAIRRGKRFKFYI